MQILDLFFLLVLISSLAWGARRGYINETLFLLLWIVAFTLAQHFAPVLARDLDAVIASKSTSYIICFFFVFLTSAVIGILLAKLHQKYFHPAKLQPVDRAIGALIGVLRGVSLLVSLTLVVGITPLQASELWQKSAGTGAASSALNDIKHLFNQDFRSCFLSSEMSGGNISKFESE